MLYSGKSKLELCRRLGNDWLDLATCLDIPAHRRNQFQQGRECYAILEWLEERNERLQKLPEALKDIEREDLLLVFEGEKTPQLQQYSDDDGGIHPFKQNAFPHLLCYLPDRKPQKEALKEAIKAYRAQYADKKQRPLLCLIHGNENEYGHFIKCLLEDFLLNDNALSESFRGGRLEIELLLEEFHTVDKLPQEILAFLENKINAKPEKEAIANKLARERRPIIIPVHILTNDLEEWQDDQKTIIEGFIEFWADWPKKVYAQHQLFLVFLSFSYEGGKNHFSVFKNWFRWKRKANHSVLRKQFETLNQKYPTIMDFFENQHVHAKVLPKLESVKRMQACNWVSTHEEQIKHFWLDTDALKEKVKALYEKRDAIPMDDLARELKQLLTQPNQ
ncbi:MAG TPA: hypothetical protein EYP59_02780 [Thiotrichaceae bacterium]|nr:hypothetical protein [Thiotrichaceae bacterium]